MSLVQLVLGVLAIAALAVPASADEPAPAPAVEPTHRLQELAPGVHLAQGTGVVETTCNALVVVNEDHVVVVDAHVTPDAGRALVASVAALTDKPIRYLVNTHAHYDHAFGNAGFPAETKILAHRRAKETLEQGPKASALFQKVGNPEAVAVRAEEAKDRAFFAQPKDKQRAQREAARVSRHAEALKALEIRVPDVAVDERHVLEEGGRRIELLFLGRGHTNGDLVVWLPAEKLLFAGDLVQTFAPYLGDSFPDEWLATLDAVAAMPWEWLVPGHGQPFQEREPLDLQKRFIADFAGQVRALRAEGFAAKDATAHVDLEPWKGYAGWMYFVPPVIPLQVQRIYALDAAKTP